MSFVSELLISNTITLQHFTLEYIYPYDPYHNYDCVFLAQLAQNMSNLNFH